MYRGSFTRFIIIFSILMIVIMCAFKGPQFTDMFADLIGYLITAIAPIAISLFGLYILTGAFRRR